MSVLRGRLHVHGLVVLGLWTLSACSTYGPIPPPSGPPGGATVPAPGGAADAGRADAGSPAAVPDASDRGQAPNAASAALLAQSRSARASGELDRAGAAIERALAIEPNNAQLWIELAEIRAAEGDYAQADTLARKALTLAGNDRAVVERARQLTSQR